MKNDFLMAGASTNNTGHDPNHVWLPPPIGTFKLNVDAAYSSESKLANCGMVVRDFKSSIYLCATMKIGNIASALHAELYAISFGLKITQDNSCFSIMVESNSLLAIQNHQASGIIL